MNRLLLCLTVILAVAATAWTATAQTPTYWFSQYAGDPTSLDTVDLVLDGRPAPPGTLVQAFNPRGTIVGAITTTVDGKLPPLRVYGEDVLWQSAGSIATDGMRYMEPVRFTINGEPATSVPPDLYFDGNPFPRTISLEAGEPCRTIRIVQQPYDILIWEETYCNGQVPTVINITLSADAP